MSSHSFPTRRSSDLVTRFEDFDLAAQDNGQSQISLACLKDEFTTAQDATGSERLEESKLAIVELGKGDTLGIAIELLVLFEIGHSPESL